MIKQKQFEKEHREFWQMLKTLQNTKKKQAKSSHLPEDFRKLCQHLAIARSRQYGSALITELEDITFLTYQNLYKNNIVLRHRIASYFLYGFPNAVRKNWKYVLFSGFLFFIPLILFAVLVQYFPHISYMVLGSEQVEQMEKMYDPVLREVRDRTTADDIYMLGFYIRNNVSIDFQCFAGGMLFGVGALFYIFYNGMAIGTVMGHLVAKDFNETFFSFVAGHSSLELIAAVLAGAAGMILGMALLAPGRLTRVAALQKAVKDAVYIMYGTAFMTFSAAFIEAFWSPNQNIPVILKYTVGITGWILIILYFSFCGRNHAIRKN